MFDLNGQKSKKQRRPKAEGSVNDGKSYHQSEDTKTKMSDGETMTLKSMTVVTQVQSKNQASDEESDEDELKVLRDTTKRKAPTDCYNPDFTSTIN